MKLSLLQPSSYKPYYWEQLCLWGWGEVFLGKELHRARAFVTGGNAPLLVATQAAAFSLVKIS
jgi:hypothetical protein